MSPLVLFTFVIGYFLLLLGVAWYTLSVIETVTGCWWLLAW